MKGYNQQEIKDFMTEFENKLCDEESKEIFWARCETFFSIVIGIVLKEKYLNYFRVIKTDKIVLDLISI